MADHDLHQDQLEAWLSSQPQQVSLVIGARAALRVLPLMAPFLDDDAEENSATILLPLWRGVAAPRAAAVYRAPDAQQRLTAVARAANRVLFDVMKLARPPAAATPSVKFRLAAAESAAESAASFSTAVSYSSFAAARGAAVRAFYAASDSVRAIDSAAVARASFAAARATDSAWQQDQEFIVKGGSAADLTKKPLWHRESPPREIGVAWLAMKRSLSDLDQDWDVWIRWYEDRLNGAPSIETLEIVRHYLPEESWGQGPKVINAEIRSAEENYWALVACDENEIKSASTTSVDVVTGAPVLLNMGPFEIREDELHYDPSLPSADNQSDSTLAVLLSRLQQRLELLRQRGSGLHNQHPVLAQTLDDYQAEIAGKSTGEVDVLGAWMTGAGLVEQVRAHGLNEAGVMAEPLEPELDGLLREICRLHAAFIMGFEQGEALARRSGIPLLDRAEWQALLENQRTFVAGVLEQSALSDNARRILRELDHTVLNAGIKVENAAEIAFPVVRDVLIALGRHARPAVQGFAVVAGLGLADGMAAAWVMFLQEYMGPVLALAASQPELRDYFDWYYAHLEEKNEPAGE